MIRTLIVFLSAIMPASLAAVAVAEVGDPQIRTDHVWYPGELACSTFPRLSVSQAKLYQHVTGITPTSDQDRALASWLWRNTHYWHGEEGARDLWGKGFLNGGDLRSREYWNGQFAYGFGLCGTTHSQWTAEMNALLGHGRGRDLGVDGHNSFEVFLTGKSYDAGKWVLLDHDLSTVVFDEQGKSLLSIPDVRANLKAVTDRSYRPEKQHGWLVCGLAEEDGAVYDQYNTAEYLAGYAGPPPMVHLRRGEILRRYFEPGLDDGKTFVFWGRDYGTAGVPGPERSQTWVNQPEMMHGSTTGTGHHPGKARFANAVYEYSPTFLSSDYREGVIEDDENHVVFEFQTPYIIAATPTKPGPWGIYEPGCRNGLILHGRATCPVAVSTDDGATWQPCGDFTDGLDLTDRVKGRQGYWLRFEAGADKLARTGLSMTTVCQTSVAVLPRLKDDGTEVSFEASGQAIVSAGPELPNAQTHLIDGGFGTPRVTLELAPPRGETVTVIYAAAHVASGNPPNPDVKYQIEFSVNGGTIWQPVVKDWSIPRRGDEPADFWSQSLCWGSVEVPPGATGPVQIRFRNNAGKNYLRAEAHLVYHVAGEPGEHQDATQVTFDWSDDRGEHRASQTFAATDADMPAPEPWSIPTGRDVKTRWVEFTPVVPER